MQRKRGLGVFLWLFVLMAAQSAFASWPKGADPTGRYLVDRDGKAFFWLGDTAWLLSQIPDREDAEHYLAARARQGFTVIQAAAVMGEERVAGTARPNAYGDRAYENGNQYKFDVNALAIRKQAYWSYLSGGYHTYGNTDVWNFSSYKAEAKEDWKLGINSPGAAHLTVLTKILGSMEWWRFVPDPSILTGGDKNVAMRSKQGDAILVYLSNPAAVSVHMDKITASESVQATWIDVRTGERTQAGAFPNKGTVSFTLPSDWEDGLLLLGQSRP